MQYNLSTAKIIFCLIFLLLLFTKNDFVKSAYAFHSSTGCFIEDDECWKIQDVSPDDACLDDPFYFYDTNSCWHECPDSACFSAPTPTTSCTDDFQYDKCVDCNTSQSVYQNTCTGEFSTDPEQFDPACEYLCPDPTPVCIDEYIRDECTDCNTSRPVYENSCTGELSPGPEEFNSLCGYLCDQPPTPTEPISSPIPTPTTPPIETPCTVTSAFFNATSVIEGDTVTLTAEVNGDCTGKQVEFRICEYDSFFEG